MTFNGILQIAIFCIAIIALTRPLGGLTGLLKIQLTISAVNAK